MPCLKVVLWLLSDEGLAHRSHQHSCQELWRQLHTIMRDSTLHFMVRQRLLLQKDEWQGEERAGWAVSKDLITRTRNERLEIILERLN